MFVDKKVGKPHNAADALHVFWTFGGGVVPIIVDDGRLLGRAVICSRIGCQYKPPLHLAPFAAICDASFN